jgi:hypothetical protein
MKQPSMWRKVRHVGRWKICEVAYPCAAAYHLLWLAHLQGRGVTG